MVVVPSFLTISTGLFIGHSVGGLTGGKETRVLNGTQTSHLLFHPNTKTKIHTIKKNLHITNGTVHGSR
jgi:hypothetical protein